MATNNNDDSNGNVDTIILPVISLSDTSPENASRTLAAATKYGFLYLDTPSTALTRTQIDSIFSLARDFFAQPVSAKIPYQINTANRGWTGLRNEILDPAHQARGDFKEAFNIALLAARASEIHGFAESCRQTVTGVLDLLGRALDIQAAERERFFSMRHTQPSGSTLRLLHYPADEKVDIAKDIRAGAHSDYGSCTLLFQRLGQPGLEIRTPSGAWAPVAVSTVHRVVFPHGEQKDRYSIAYFAHPGNDVELVAVPSKLVQEHKFADGEEVGYGGGVATEGVGRAMTAREHLNKRLQATYGFREEAK
ncbi:hypothetical protein DV738_g5019, partial [Chaetothyriales sp. CBS 135597]